MAKRKSKPEEAPVAIPAEEEAVEVAEPEVPVEVAEPEAPAQEKAAPSPPPAARVQVRYSEKAEHPGLLAGRQVQPGEVHTVAYGAYLRAKQANPAHYELVGEVNDGGQ
jgi:hypothetical protein